MRHPRNRRALVGSAAALILLAACGTTDAPDSTGTTGGTGAVTSAGATESAGTGTADGAGSETSAVTTAGSEITCDAPPALPSEALSFTTLPPTTDIAGKTLVATLETNCGPITLELDGAAAPQTVASFQNLGQGGYWDNSPCHRLTTEGIWVLQCGDPTGTGRGAPGYSFGIENAPEDGVYPAGTVAMARAQAPDSNGGQFFIVYDETQLPVEGGGYSIFGKVTGGMDILEHVAAAGVTGGISDGPPTQPISILKVDISEKKA